MSTLVSSSTAVVATPSACSERVSPTLLAPFLGGYGTEVLLPSGWQAPLFAWSVGGWLLATAVNQASGGQLSPVSAFGC